MTRRPRRNRPPRLDDLVPADMLPERPGSRTPPAPRPRRALVDARVTGSHARLGRDAVRHAVRLLVRGDRHARLGIDLDACAPDEVRAALVETHGWDPDSPRAGIDPDLTLAALRAAAARLVAAAASGGRIALATTRPASLLGLALATTGLAEARGATVASAEPTEIDGLARHALSWVGGVAVVTDGQSLVAHDAVPGGEDWLFAVGRVDLVVADRGFAGAAVRAGVETVAWVDLDAPALAVAAARGRPVTVVPIDEQRPAPSYEAVVAVLEDVLADAHARHP